MPNTLNLAEIYNDILDEQIVQESVTTKMEANPLRVRYEGGDTVKILKMDLSGLGNYDKNATDPFTSGAIDTDWESKSFGFDRGQSFNIDAVDDRDQLVRLSGMVMGQFQKRKVVPEVDACRFARIWEYALPANQVERYTVDSSTIFQKIKDNIKKIRKVVGNSESLTCYISYDASEALDFADKITHQLSLTDFTSGEVRTKVRAIDGVPLIEVPDDRFYTEVTLSSTDGFTNPVTASFINWVIVMDDAVTALVKQQKLRTFSPEVNQRGDRWLIQYRKVHDLWITDENLIAIFVNHAGVAAPALSSTIAAGTGTGNTKFTATPAAGNSLAYVLSAADPGVKYLDVITAGSPVGAVTGYTSGADIAATAGQYLTMLELNSSGRVVKSLVDVLEAGDISTGA